MFVTKDTNIMTWKEQLANSIRNVEEVKSLFNFSGEISEKATQIYPLQITPHYLKLIDKKNPDDPLKKIVLPSIQEMNLEGLPDTMGEKEDYKIQGLQHRYPQTALIIVNDFCASYCRYCFRKRLFNPEKLDDENIHNIEEALEYIKQHKEITNVLFSGGDPLMASSKKLKKILNIIQAIRHIQYVRIGTKIPAFLPQRILEDNELLNTFSEFNKSKPLYIVSHFDHPNEISKETSQAVSKLLGNGLSVLSYIVLLKDVNDNKEILSDLLSKLVQNRIIPYYIFQAMPVVGSTHFQVSLEDGIEIFNEKMQTLSGLSKKIRFIIPHYVGKVEFLGKDNSYFYMRHHQARDVSKVGKLFKVKKAGNKFWFNSNEITYL